jgi:hypothetical protein
MNPLGDIPRILGLSLVILGIPAGDSLGQPPPDTNGPVESAQFMRETGFWFSLSQPEDINRLARVRYIGVLEATLALEKLARKEYNREDDEPHRAAQLLVLLRASEPRALAALCDNLLTLKGNGDTDGGSPLVDFEAARALVAIGGTRVREAIFDSLRKPLDQRELLIRGHVLARLDPPPIMCEHIKMAIADQEERQRINAIPDDEQYLAKLRQLHDWLKGPQFLKDRQNWP